MNRAQMGASASKGMLPNFEVGNYIMVAPVRKRVDRILGGVACSRNAARAKCGGHCYEAACDGACAQVESLSKQVAIRREGAARRFYHIQESTWTGPCRVVSTVEVRQLQSVEGIVTGSV